MQNWMFDRGSHELKCGDVTAQLTPKAAAVLMCLMERRGEVVSREEILKNVWADLHVTPDLVREYIFDLRTAVGDDAQSPKFIETIRGKGFRFIGGIRETQLVSAPTTQSTPSETRATLAILKPKVSSTEPSMHVLANDVASDMVNELGRMRDIFVVSRSSSFSIDDDQDATSIADQLNADYLLESSLRLSGDLLRARFQLIDGSTGLAVWSEKLEFIYRDKASAQDHITETIVPALSGWHGALHLATFKAVTLRETSELNAFEHYIRACDINLSLDEAGLRRSLFHLRKSLELDPRFARCWAMKSVMLKWAVYVFDEDGSALMREASEAIDKAHALEPDDPSTNALLAVDLAARGNIKEAEIAANRAAQSAGSDQDACIAAATPLAVVLGDCARARLMLDRAISPGQPVAGYHRLVEARVAFFLDDFERSIDASRLGFVHVSSLAFRALSMVMLNDECSATNTVTEICSKYPRFSFQDYADTFPIHNVIARRKFNTALTKLENVTGAQNL